MRAAALVAAHLQKAGEQYGIGHVRQATALPTPDAVFDFLQRNMPSRFSGRYGPLRNQLQGRPLCPQPLLRRTHPYNGGAIWRKNPKSSKSCSMTH